MSPETADLIERLPSMTARAMRVLAREQGISITYLSQRPRENLLAALEHALRKRGEREG